MVTGLLMPFYLKLPGFLNQNVMKRIPRDFKAAIKKIPAGEYCYGEFLGSRPKRENGKSVFKGGFCPYWNRAKGEQDEDGQEEPNARCTFMNCTDDVLLADQIKICWDYDMLFDYKTGKININGSHAECLLIQELPKEQQEPFRMWLNGKMAPVPNIGTFATKEHYDYWLNNVWKEIMRLQQIRESKEAL